MVLLLHSIWKILFSPKRTFGESWKFQKKNNIRYNLEFFLSYQQHVFAILFIDGIFWQSTVADLNNTDYVYEKRSNMHGCIL